MIFFPPSDNILYQHFPLSEDSVGLGGKHMQQVTQTLINHKFDQHLLMGCPCLVVFNKYSVLPSSSRWIEKVNLKVRATCANPPELKGRRVKDVQVFRACPGGENLPSPPTVTPKSAKAPKATKPKPMHLNGLRHIKMLQAKSKLRKNPNTKQAAAKKNKRRSMA